MRHCETPNVRPTGALTEIKGYAKGNNWLKNGASARLCVRARGHKSAVDERNAHVSPLNKRIVVRSHDGFRG